MRKAIGSLMFPLAMTLAACAAHPTGLSNGAIDGALEGEECDEWVQCAPDLVCVGDDSGAVVHPTDGRAAVHPTNGRAAVPPRNGGAVHPVTGQNADGAPAPQVDDVDGPSHGVCRAHPTEGGVCNEWVQCAKGLICVVTNGGGSDVPSQGVCAPTGPECNEWVQCGPGSVCVVTNGGGADVPSRGVCEPVPLTNGL